MNPLDTLADAYNYGPLRFVKCTLTVASPCVITRQQHGLKVGDRVTFSTSSVLPTGITGNNTDTWYWVISAGLTEDDFEISTTKGGSAVNTSGSQSGFHFFAAERTPRLSAYVPNCR